MQKDDSKLNYDKQFIKWFEDVDNRKIFVKTMNYLKVKDNDFSSVKSSSCLYLTNSDFLRWIKEVLNSTEFADCDSYRGLLDYRGGQYSNATLYSSSRLALELFNQKPFVISLLKECFKSELNIIELINLNKYNVNLEYLLPIHLIDDNNKNVTTNSHMDVLIKIGEDIENPEAILAVECKMKEIYTIEKNEFTSSYLPILRKICESNKNIYKLNGTILNIIDEKTNEIITTRLYYKQQICHLIGLSEYKNNHKDTIVKFANFVFDPHDFNFDELINNSYDSYINDASKDGIIKSIINNYSDFNEIEYCGVFSQVIINNKVQLVEKEK